MGRQNVYIKKEHEELVKQGKKKGITPSKAIIEGYKFLIGKTASYSILEEKREVLLKELAQVESEMDKLRDEVHIDPTNQENVLRDLARAYIDGGMLPDQVLNVRRVELKLSLEEMKKLVHERIIAPVDAGRINIFNYEEAFCEQE